MYDIFGFFIVIMFFGLALRLSLTILKIIFTIIGFIIMITVFPIITVPFLAIFGIFSFIINVLIVPLLIIGGVIFFLKIIF